MKKIRAWLILCVATVSMAIGLVGCPPPVDPVGETVTASRIRITGIPLELTDANGDAGATDDSIGWIMVSPRGSGGSTAGIAVFNAEARFPGAGLSEIVQYGQNTGSTDAKFYANALTISTAMANFIAGTGGPVELPDPVDLTFPADAGIEVWHVAVKYRNVSATEMLDKIEVRTWKNFSIDGGVVTVDWNDAVGSENVTVPGNSLADKLAWLKGNVMKGGTYTVEVTKDENIDPQNLAFTNSAGNALGSVTVRLVNIGQQQRKVGLTQDKSIFSVGKDVTLELSGNIIINGRSSNSNPLVDVASGGTLIIKDGIKITGNGGTGVRNGGTFVMEGGEISANVMTTGTGSGGGVNNGGEFTMNKGNIFENLAMRDGGGVYNYGANAIFNFTGGTISGNTARDGGGVHNGKTFTMSGGEISSNTANRNGGGVNDAYNSPTNYGTFTMTGGVVYGSNAGNNANTATGSGVALFDGTSTTGGIPDGISKDDTITSYQSNP